MLRQDSLVLIFTMTMQKKFMLTAMATLLLLGCGQRGPLYLPEQAPQNQPDENNPAPNTEDLEG
jgi:predicted small lipoprotein YifL